MKLRIVKIGDSYYPQKKKFLWWRSWYGWFDYGQYRKSYRNRKSYYLKLCSKNQEIVEKFLNDYIEKEREKKQEKKRKKKIEIIKEWSV